MTLRLTHRWAGARGAVAAIAAFATVVVRKPRVRSLACEAKSGVCKDRARLTLANCRGDYRLSGLRGCVHACRMGECDGIEKFPETGLRSKHVWRVSDTVLQGTSVNDQ